MRKILCCLLCILIIAASSVGYAALSYTLPEKMQKQLAIGSGLKGSLTLTAEGSDPVMLTLEPFSGVELQVRGIKSDNDWHVYLYQAGENEAQNGLTEFCAKGGTYYARSDMLPGQVFSLPPIVEAIDRVTGKEGGNPPYLSMLMNIMNQGQDTLKERWEPIIDKLLQKLDIWIGNYALTNGTKDEASGATTIEFIYTIPIAELRSEIVSLLADLRSDPEAQALLQSVMSDGQKDFYLNEYLDYFFMDAMSSLKYDYDVFMTRVVSPLGEVISSYIELPLDESRFGGYNTLIVNRENGVSGITLRGAERNLQILTEKELTPESFTSGTFWIMTWPEADQEKTEAAYTASRIEIEKSSATSTDEDSRDHQNDNWKIQIIHDTSRLPEDADPSIYKESQPIILELSLAYSSKYSQSSPTTLDVDAKLEKENLSVRISGQLKTASPWVFSPFETENARDILSLTENEKNLLLAEWFASATERLKKP